MSLMENNVCLEHGEQITLFCMDCNDTICLECLTDRHNRHTVQKVKQTLSDVRRQTDEVKKSMEAYIRRLELAQIRVGSIHIDNVKKIECTRVFLKKQIDSRLDALARDSLAQKQKDVEAISTAKSAVVEKIEDLDRIVLVEEQWHLLPGHRKFVEDASQNDEIFESCAVTGESNIYSGPSLEPGSVAVGALGTDLQSELQLRYKPVNFIEKPSKCAAVKSFEATPPISDESEQEIVPATGLTSKGVKGENEEPRKETVNQDSENTDTGTSTEHGNEPETLEQNKESDEAESHQPCHTSIKISPITGLPVLNNYYKSAACFLKEGDTVRIQVMELVSPEVWYVTFVDHTEPERQQELKDEMSRCYGEKEERMSCSPTKRGLVAAKFEGDLKWYRAEVIALNTHVVKLRYIDFGNESSVRLSWVQPLESRHQGLPAQAVCISLSGVTAPEGGWSAEAERYVDDLVAGATLEATVVKANTIAASLRVSAQDGTNISEILIKKMLAKPVDYCQGSDASSQQPPPPRQTPPPQADPLPQTATAADGRELRIYKETRQGRVSKRVILCNIAEEMRPSEIEDQLLELEPPVTVQAHTDQDGKWTGTAVVFLKNSRDARRAKKLLDKKGGISAHNLEF